VPYIARGLDHFVNKKFGDGGDVDFVRRAADVPSPSVWRRGDRVQNNINILPGTAIATFLDQNFDNLKSGGWAVIYVSQDAGGLRVLTQYDGTRVHEEVVAWHASAGDSNTGDRFYIIE
jgi:hypothetical protein